LPSDPARRLVETIKGVGYRFKGMKESEIVVLGAGVIGLTSAMALLEAGFSVQVRADRAVPNITSSVAAGLWYPYAVSGTRVPALAVASLRWFQRVQEDPASGVRSRNCRSILPPDFEKPSWASEAVDYTLTDVGFDARLPVADSRIFLPWLASRIRDLGGNIVIDPNSIAGAHEVDANIVVNCTGLGARQFCGDDRMYPIKGTVVLVENPGIDYCVADDEDLERPTYFIPLSAGLILGGTAEIGNWDTAIEPGHVADIIARCTLLEPRVADARVLATKSGLRPGRDEVRLETERIATGQTVVHNYGHGGSGFTLARGCAEEVVRMVRGLLPEYGA
jgi:D-amino-acid oxidase